MRAGLLGALVLLGACGAPRIGEAADGGTTGGSGGNGQVLTILTGDFDGFMQWTHYDLGSADTDGIHGNADRVAYLNKVPPSGSTSFPLGTIIVKTVGSGADAGHTFAMAKVGGGFNPNGAENWEWFELQPTGNGDVQILWSGTQAPANETYLATMPNSCNTCHMSAASNDFVPSSQLSLSSF